ncbi:MAG: hypothetical protein D6773_07170, partial [Alphaproteobacteria bacterium]
CRDNPLARSLKTASRSLKVGSGLAPVERATGMLIAFATEPGSVALDGDGRNSPFTAALLKHIETPDLTVNDIMINVRKEVLEATNNTQIPWENSSLTGRFFFKKQKLASNYKSTTANDGTPTGSSIRVGNDTIEHTFWTSVQKSDDPALYKAYLDRYPNGIFAPIAKARLEAATETTKTAETKTARANDGTKEVKTAQLDPQATPEAPQPPKRTQAELAALLQTELKRVGCYHGAVDGLWGKGSRGAVERFNAVAKTSLIAYQPQEEVLEAVTAQKGKVCIAPQPKRTLQAGKAPRRKVATRPRPRPRPVETHEPAGPPPSIGFGFSRPIGGGGRLTIGIGGGGIRF